MPKRQTKITFKYDYRKVGKFGRPPPVENPEIDGKPLKRTSKTKPEYTAVRKENLLLASIARMKKEIIKARESPANFAEFVMRSPKGTRVKLAPFHHEWMEIFTKSRRAQIEASKSHGKTTNLLAFLLWTIGTNPNIRIKLFTSSDDKARERLTVLEEIIESNKLFHLVFPDIKPHPNGPWHKKALCVSRDITDKDPTVEAVGILGTSEGGRADLVVFDDICDHRTSLLYPQLRASIKTKIYAELLPMLEADGRAISIATPHHRLDAVASFRLNPEWESYIYPVGTIDDPFMPLWPERWSRKSLMQLRSEIGSLEYDRAYRCIEIDRITSIINQSHIQYYSREMMPDPWSLICIQAYDVAITQKKTSSYFAAVTLLYDSDANLIFVADAWHAKMGFTEQARAIVQEAKKWQPNRIVIEETGYQSALREYLFELSSEPLPIRPMTPGSKSKEMRLMETLPMFEARRIYFNPKLDPATDPNLESKGDLVSQLIGFATATDKDLGDAFAYAVKAIRDYRRDSDEGPDDWNNGEGVSTRLSILG